MYVYKVGVGVELINELLRKSMGGGGGGTVCLRRLFKPFEEFDKNNSFLIKDTELQFTIN